MSILGKYLRVLLHARPQWRRVALVALLTIALAAIVSLQPLPLKFLVDTALGELELPLVVSDSLMRFGLNPGPNTLVAGAALAAVLVALTLAALNAALTAVWARAGQEMVYGFGATIFEQLQRLSLLYHNKTTVGDSISRVTGDAWCVYALYDNALLAPARHLVVFASVAVVAWQLDAGLALILLTAVPLLTASALYFGSRVKKTALRKRTTSARVGAFVHQVLGAVALVQTYTAEERNIQIFKNIAADSVAAQRSSAVTESAFRAINGAAMTISVALIIYLGSLRVFSSAMTLGSLLVFIAYIRTLEGASRGFLNAYAALRAAEASVDRAFEILDAVEIIKTSAAAGRLPEIDRSLKGRVLSVESVTFGYQPGHPVLHKVSMSIAPGETVALVGATGAGKSTLAALVSRFFDPWHGRVTLDGVDIRDIEVTNLRDQVALVLQEPFILPLTIADNIGYGRLQASREEIVAAAVAANAHEFIRSLPKGYDTLLGENGAGLSGGQRQRLAIARALLKDAPVLILDEPTSALDSVTEAALLEALQRLMAGRTTLVIAHRLSTVRRANRIVVLKRGSIVESGTHADLMRAAGEYARLYTSNSFATGGMA